MHILDIFKDHPTTFSFEFFPPKTDAASEELFRTIAELQALRPSFVSVTYGAGGSSPNRLKEMDHLKAKVDAGADYICTQLFFDNRDFYDFRERCELAGIKVPILAGIMPISSKAGMVRMADLALGAKFPARLQKAVAR